MKNKHVEKFYKSAKEKLGQRRARTTDGKYRVYHAYRDDNGELYRKLGYWDDVGVISGSIYNMIFWTHPRYLFSDKIKQEGYHMVKKVIDFDNPIKKYKAVGKSRKKIAFYEYPHINDNSDSDETLLSYDEAFKRALEKTEYVQKCSINVKVNDSSRFIEVCYPPEKEVIDEESLIAMADEVMGFVRDYAKFYERYGSYQYDKNDYERESRIEDF